jgi:hypothetical protein
MADAKTHTANSNQSARYKKYELVDVFEVGKLQKQLKSFVTVVVTDTPFSSLHDAKVYLLESLTELRTDPASGDTDYIVLHRRKFMFNLERYDIDLLLDRTITLTWDDLPIRERPHA